MTDNGDESNRGSSPRTFSRRLVSQRPSPRGGGGDAGFAATIIIGSGGGGNNNNVDVDDDGGSSRAASTIAGVAGVVRQASATSTSLSALRDAKHRADRELVRKQLYIIFFLASHMCRFLQANALNIIVVAVSVYFDVELKDDGTRLCYAQ